MALFSLHRSTCSRATSSVPGAFSLTSRRTMGSSYRFPDRLPECDLTYWTPLIRDAIRRVVQYAFTTLTSSSVTSPSRMRNERNWKSPASSVSAVETRT